MMVSVKKYKAAGLAAGILAAISYGLNPLFALPLFSEEFSPDAVLFCRYAPAVVILGIMAKSSGEGFRLTCKEFLTVCGMGLLFSVSSLALFLSYQKMDAGIASTILFVYPLMTTVIMAVFFHEKVRAATICALVLALAGIALLYKRADGSVLSTSGVLLVLLSALTYAVYLVGAGFPVIKRIPSITFTFYVMLTGVCLYAVRLSMGIGKMGCFSLKACINILLIALIPTVFSLTMTAISVRRIGSTVTSILGALEPLTAVAVGVLLFHEEFTMRIAGGILLILLSVCLVIRRKPGNSKV